MLLVFFLSCSSYHALMFPRARAGLRIFAASIVSQYRYQIHNRMKFINKVTLPSFSVSSMILFIRSSKSPRKRVLYSVSLNQALEPAFWLVRARNLTRSYGKPRAKSSYQLQHPQPRQGYSSSCDWEPESSERFPDLDQQQARADLNDNSIKSRVAIFWTTTLSRWHPHHICHVLAAD